jgi:hypothetical protein
MNILVYFQNPKHISAEKEDNQGRNDYRVVNLKIILLPEIMNPITRISPADG